MREIRDALRQCWEKKTPCAVATIVRVDGSAYRREGARCVIDENGNIRGILSGGCLEEDVKEHAREVLASGIPKKLHYDFRWGEGSDVWGLGVGCNGAITVWLEPFDPPRFPEEARSLLEELENRAICETPYIAVTVIASESAELYPPGKRWRFAEPPADFSLPERAAGTVKAVLQNTALELFVEKINPAPRLTIIGVGEDASLLCRMAKAMEWRVRIVYHQTARASKEHFPEADEILWLPRGDFSGIPVRSDDSFVIMTHQLDLDKEAVRQLLDKGAAYIGVLGSKERIRHILESIGKERGESTDRPPDNLFSPVGLDIGAETPEEITLSIMAELIAHRRQRKGGFLRNRLQT